MAESRVTGGLPATTPASGGATPAVRAAQRAFFDAALTQAGAATAVTRQAASPPQAVQTRVRAERATPEPPPSGRVLRPGSFLDIKV